MKTLSEMLKDQVGVRLFPDKIPYFPEAVELSQSGFVPAGLYRNRDFYGKCVAGTPATFLSDLLFDPQTSGGLLIALHPDDADAFLKSTDDKGCTSWIIGEFIAEPKGKILL